MRRMSLMDAFFLINESSRTPMHVGGINLFTLPEGVDEPEFLHSLADALRHDGEMRRPFGEKLKMGPLGALGPVKWEVDDQLDLEYHIRHSAVPAPGRYRELFTLVSRLHATLLDRSRPLWEMHLIEGLQNRQFATYFKVHHCAIDGVGAMHLTNSMLSTDPNERIARSPFSIEAYEDYKAQLKQRAAPIEPKESELKAVTEILREQLGGTVHVASALRRYASVWAGRNNSLSVPWHKVPNTPFNAKITGARRFVAQSWPLERVKRAGKAFDGTLNDAVLFMCSGALRMYLERHAELPDESLKAMAPISLRPADDVDSANAIAFLTADLATHIADPEKRMRAIQESMRAGKEQLAGMSRREIEIYTTLTQAPALLSTMTGMASKFPAFSTVISNVPGPREQLYWNGAKLDGIYPVSIPFDGFSTNFTLVSNNGQLDFGIVACRRTLPQVQRLIDYMEEALQELELAAGIKPPADKMAAVKRKPVARKVGSAAKKVAVKKKAAVKAPAKAKAAKKSPAKKAVAKKAAAKKAAPKKAAAKKPAAKKAADSAA